MMRIMSKIEKFFLQPVTFLLLIFMVISLIHKKWLVALMCLIAWFLLGLIGANIKSNRKYSGKELLKGDHLTEK